MDPACHEIGELIYWTEVPIALLMKPEDAGNLWKIGVIIGHKTKKKYIVLSNGILQECLRTMVKKLSKPV
tara:strand:- start:1016 stop:1225 length:210 start_codon:yes stop_codon:yes gene_type:complete